MIPDLPCSVTDIQYATPPYAFVLPYNQRPPSTGLVVYDRFAKRGAMRAEIIVAKLKIENFALMLENWDGYGALPISPATKQNAIDALEVILRDAPTPDIIPNPNGTLSFEWETPQGIGHFEIGRTKFSFYIKSRLSAQPIFADGQASQFNDDIGKLVSDFLFPAGHGAEPMTKISYVGYVFSAG